MNLPTQIMAIYIANITQCYERIPLEGRDNLHEALGFIVWKGFLQHNGTTKNHSIWVHINMESGLADRAKWDKKRLGSTCWIEMSYKSIMQIQSWMINNCYIKLGDVVWRQRTGIPMGFSCSPIWCNMYFMAYEIQLISRLLNLNRFDLLDIF